MHLFLLKSSTPTIMAFTGVTIGAFTQSVLRGIIRRRLGYVILKNIFFIKKTTILRRVIRRGVNAT